MTKLVQGALLLSGSLALLAIACSSGGSGREIEIEITDTDCSPTSVQLTAGEKVTFVVDNKANGDRELEGIEGTNLEEVLIPAGRTRKVNYTAPKEEGTQKMKCYIPGGPSTIIEAKVSASGGKADTTVEAILKEYSVGSSVTEVNAGVIRFVGKNEGAVIHELAVLSVAGDGSKREVADVEDIGPGKAREFTAKLNAGRYELACLIAPGEAGSTLDHYQQGMHTEFTVK